LSMGLCQPQLGIGIHLNLSQWAPVSPAFKIPTLVDARGRLHLTPGRLGAGILKHEVSLSDVERELHAQIERVMRAGLRPTHLDGHKHVHVLPGVAPIVIRLAQRFGIRCVRCPDEQAPNRLVRFNSGARTAVIKQYLVGRVVSALARRFRRQLYEAGLICPDHFYGLSETGFLNTRSLKEILGRLPEGQSELMCHPGCLNLDLIKTGTRLLSQRVVELHSLMAPEVRKFAADQGIRLINYRDLAPSRQPAEAVA
ncbi:MAG TPA: ChbG/HpnK family deacetylase, partial [Candidatus Acidoferrum sp.]|nr:ChbG/HpnK family deacetylase [Candidatus Acidoferrum sp.]